MQCNPGFPQPCDRFNGQNVLAACCKPGGVAACAGTQVDDFAGAYGKKMADRSVKIRR